MAAEEPRDLLGEPSIKKVKVEQLCSTMSGDGKDAAEATAQAQFDALLAEMKAKQEEKDKVTAAKFSAMEAEKSVELAEAVKVAVEAADDAKEKYYRPRMESLEEYEKNEGKELLRKFVFGASEEQKNVAVAKDFVRNYEKVELYVSEEELATEVVSWFKTKGKRDSSQVSAASTDIVDGNDAQDVAVYYPAKRPPHFREMLMLYLKCAKTTPPGSAASSSSHTESPAILLVVGNRITYKLKLDETKKEKLKELASAVVDDVCLEFPECGVTSAGIASASVQVHNLRDFLGVGAYKDIQIDPLYTYLRTFQMVELPASI